jgi:hypothetical protein
MICCCLSISFDPALQGQAPSPVEYPAFHRFATRFLAEVPALPCMANLQENSLLLILITGNRTSCPTYALAISGNSPAGLPMPCVASAVNDLGSFALSGGQRNFGKGAV